MFYIDPCSTTQCDFYGECTVNEDGRTACKCPVKCPEKIDFVCGTDGQNYENDCKLRREACTRKKRLSIYKLGTCGKYCIK
jgi:coxsackievirus/adenovirus receptor